MQSYRTTDNIIPAKGILFFAQRREVRRLLWAFIKKRLKSLCYPVMKTRRAYKIRTTLDLRLCGDYPAKSGDFQPTGDFRLSLSDFRLLCDFRARSTTLVRLSRDFRRLTRPSPERAPSVSIMASVHPAQAHPPAASGAFRSVGVYVGEAVSVNRRISGAHGANGRGNMKDVYLLTEKRKRRHGAVNARKRHCYISLPLQIPPSAGVQGAGRAWVRRMGIRERKKKRPGRSRSAVVICLRGQAPR